ncbi:MAG: hypothetical protein ACWIPH_03390 [Ostreibacterium sp.]
MGKPNKIQASVWQAVQHYQQNSKEMLWHHDEFSEAIENAENEVKSIAVLKKQLPERFHELVRFAQPKTIWYLNVEKGLIATQLTMLLDALCLRIAKDIGYAPRLKVMVKPSHNDWLRAGLPLAYMPITHIQLPTPEEATEIINRFLKDNK